jgi:acyl-CoA synthetase (NDP forming)
VSIRNLDAVFSPRSVAVIGASPRPGTVGATVTRNILLGGFKGKVGLVNPRHAEIDGVPCVARISRLSELPELGIIATPAETVPTLVAELAQAGARAAVIITAGMSRERKTQALARHDLKVSLQRILGSDIGVSNALLNYVAEQQTDLLVMGGYGHSRFREFVLGGATRGMLDAMTVPVLMAH